jgi:hypothetical protein
MTTENYFKGIKHIVRVTTDDVDTTCEVCFEFIGKYQKTLGINKFATFVNHYIEAHNYKLLHIGTETSYETNSSVSSSPVLWHCTVAILGK